MAQSKFFQTVIKIEKLSPKGYGVGSVQQSPKHGIKKVVVPGALPGDHLLIEVGAKRKDAYLGRLLELITPAETRVLASCKHAGICGGCSLQQMAYSEQLAHKQRGVEALFPEAQPIVFATSIWHYRNKMEYTFSQDREGTKFLGLIKAASKGRVEQIEECFLAPIWFTKAVIAVRKWWENSTLLAFHGTKNTGSLRNLTIREGKNTGEKMVILTVSGSPEYALTKEQLSSFTKAVLEVVEEGVVSIFLQIQQAAAGRQTQFYEMELFGPAYFHEKLTVATKEYKQEYCFAISPTAFFQPNTDQAEKIYSKALEIAGRKNRKRVLDLYAGTATLGMIFSPFTEQVIAIELNPYAVFDAERNREINKVENLQIYKGDVGEVLAALYAADSSLAQTDLVIVDPPRGGLMPQAKDLLCKLLPKEILYISCNPVTQAADIQQFVSRGYKIAAVQPIDQFPHTVHLENIVLLNRF